MGGQDLLRRLCYPFASLARNRSDVEFAVLGYDLLGLAVPAQTADFLWLHGFHVEHDGCHLRHLCTLEAAQRESRSTVRNRHDHLRRFGT